jgi:pseudouridine-5'-phosphate glycosidase
MHAKWGIGLTGGLVIANPIPVEEEIPAGEITPAIEEAVADAKRQGVAGKDVTPFLLARIGEATQGRSLAANIALVENNVLVAARIAAAYARLP